MKDTLILVALGGSQQWPKYLLWSLLPLWKTQVELQAPDPAADTVEIRGGNQWVRDICLSAFRLKMKYYK